MSNLKMSAARGLSLNPKPAVYIALLVLTVTLAYYVLLQHDKGCAGLVCIADKLSQIDGLKAKRVLVGADAVKIVKQIHYNPSAFNPRDALMIIYDDSSRLWLVVLDDPCYYVRRMAERIVQLQHILPYTPPHVEEINGVKFYITVDKRDNSYHVFWCDEERDFVVWLEIRSARMLGEGFHEILRVLGEAP